MSSESKVVFVTGASTGIGEACVHLFAKHGYRVAFCARSKDKLDRLSESVRQSTYKTVAYSLDVTDAQAVQRVVQSVYQDFSQIDIVINNAGLALGSPKPFWQQEITDVQQVINTNVLGAMYVTHAVLRSGMIERGSGDIINVSSITGLDAPPMGEASYHSSKTGLEGFSNALRQELDGTNLRVLVVRPGFVGGSAAFHYTRHGEDSGGPQGEATFAGLEPLLPEDVAQVILTQVQQPERVSLRAVDVVPTAQRSLYVADREWNERHGLH